MNRPDRAYYEDRGDYFAAVTAYLELEVARLTEERDEARRLAKRLLVWCHIHRDDGDADRQQILILRSEAEAVMRRWREESSVDE